MGIQPVTLAPLARSPAPRRRPARIDFDELFRLSVGLPRNICKICDMALLRAYANEQAEVDTNIIRQTAEQLAISEEEPTHNGKSPATEAKGEAKPKTFEPAVAQQ